jgi:hypothetical protein
MLKFGEVAAAEEGWNEDNESSSESVSGWRGVMMIYAVNDPWKTP